MSKDASSVRLRVRVIQLVVRGDGGERALRPAAGHVVGPEGGQRVEAHALGDVVVAGVVLDDRLCDGDGGQRRDGDHRGGRHHGVEDERQAVGHVAVGRAGQRWGVTWGGVRGAERSAG